MSIQLSYSASQKYQQSPRSYYLHYILRLRPEKVGSALAFGNAIDSGINTLLRNQMVNSEKKDPYEVFNFVWTKQNINGKDVDLRKSDIITYSKADYDESILIDEDITLINKGYNKNWVSLRRKGYLIIDAYNKQIIPRIKEVIVVQKYVNLKNECDDKFIGWIDFICKWEDDKIYIVDNKTTSIKYKEDSVSTSEQLATYFEGVIEEIKPDGAMYIAIPKKFRKKKEPLIPIDVITGTISEALIEKTFNDYDKTLNGIKMGNFPCTGCKTNPFGCSYTKYCETNGEDLSGLIYIKEKKNKE